MRENHRSQTHITVEAIDLLIRQWPGSAVVCKLRCCGARRNRIRVSSGTIFQLRVEGSEAADGALPQPEGCQKGIVGGHREAQVKKKTGGRRTGLVGPSYVRPSCVRPSCVRARDFRSQGHPRPSAKHALPRDRASHRWLSYTLSATAVSATWELAPCTPCRRLRDMEHDSKPMSIRTCAEKGSGPKTGGAEYVHVARRRKEPPPPPPLLRWPSYAGWRDERRRPAQGGHREGVPEEQIRDARGRT